MLSGKWIAQCTTISPYFLYFNTASKYQGDEEEEEDEGEEEEIEPISSTGTLWFHSDGDSLSRLRAMGAFAYASSKGEGTEVMTSSNLISCLPGYPHFIFTLDNFYTRSIESNWFAGG